MGGGSSEMRIYLQGLDQGLLTRVRVLKAVLVPVGAAKVRGECMGWLHSHPRNQRNPETLGGNCRPSAEAWQRAQPCSQRRMGGGTSLPSCRERDDLNHSPKNQQVAKPSSCFQGFQINQQEQSIPFHHKSKGE